MISKLPNIVVPKGEPFKNCCLGRKRYADILTQIVTNYTNGGVIALNGAWGTGKTTFMKMWSQDLIDNGFHTLYFNVWEDDFISDPLVGLIGQFEDLCKSEEVKSKFIEVLTFAGKVVASTAPAILKVFAKHYLSEDIVGSISDATNEIGDVFKREIETYQEQRNSIREFRKTLRNFVYEYFNGKPIIFIVDELDRCNPHYAVKVLERIKHLFDIPNIIFVLSIDKKQLCSSIRGYFGTDKLNAEEYLQRFINLEYQLPHPDADSFCNYLYEVYDFESYFSRVNNEYRSSKEMFKRMSTSFFKKLNLSLREMDRLYSHIRLSLKSYNSTNNVYAELILLLLYMKKKDISFYNMLKEHKCTIQDIVTFFESEDIKNVFYCSDAFDYSVRYTTLCLAYLLVLYSHGKLGDENIKLLNNETILNFKIHIIDEKMMLEAIKTYSQSPMTMYDNLNNYISHIDLLNTINGI